MPYGRFNFVVQDDDGNIVDGASIEVRSESVGAALAILYSDRDGTTPLGNPYTASDGANAGFFTTGGSYKVTATLGAFTREWRYVAVGTAQETDASAIRPGILLTWDTATTDADPGEGKIRASNASLALASFLYVDEATVGGSNIETFLLTLDDSTNGVKGVLILTDPTAQTQATFLVSGVTDASGYVKIAVGSHSGETSFTSGSEITLQFARAGDAGSAGGGVAHNFLLNGDFQVWQQGTSIRADTVIVNNDDRYVADQWNLLSDGNDIVDVSQETSVVPSGGLYAIALDVETVNKKFGIVQFLEQRNSKGLIGNTVTFSFKAKVSSTTKLDNVKAAIISWDGTADVLTSDIISAWNVEGTNPTLVANWTYENTPANLSLTTSYATYSISAAVDTASTKNVAVFIWSDVTDTTLGDFLYITDAQLEIGASPSTFVPHSAGESLDECQRYFYRRQSISTTDSVGNMQAFSTAAVAGKLIDLPVRMRVAPTVTFSDIGHIGALTANAGAENAFTGSTIAATPEMIGGTLTGSSGLAAGDATAVRFNTAAGFIDASARL